MWRKRNMETAPKMTEIIRYATHDQLLKIAEFSVKAGVNRQINPDVVKALPKRQKFPIVYSMLHNDELMRAQFVITTDGRTVWVDFPIEVFNMLTTLSA